MPLTMSAAFREDAAVAAANLGALMSLHTGDPGANGTANEATGGGYSRLSTTWTGGTIDGSVPGTAVEFSAAAGTYSYYCVRKSDGTFLWSQSFSAITLPQAMKLRVTPTFTVPQGT